MNAQQAEALVLNALSRLSTATESARKLLNNARQRLQQEALREAERKEDLRRADAEAIDRKREEAIALIEARYREGIAGIEGVLAGSDGKLKDLIARFPHSWRGTFSLGPAPSPGESLEPLRVGRLLLPSLLADFDFPALIPFLGHGHILVDEGEWEGVRGVLECLLLRLVTTLPPQAFRLHLVDPVEAGAAFAIFARIARAQGLRGVAAGEDDGVETVREVIRQMRQSIAEHHFSSRFSFEDFNARNPDRIIPYHVLVMSDLRILRDFERGRGLAQLLTVGPSAGIYLLAALSTEDEGLFLPSRRNGRRLPVSRVSVTDAGRLHCRVLGEDSFEASTDALPEFQELDELVQHAATVRVAAPPSFSYRAIAIPDALRWNNSSSDDLWAPIGRTSTGDAFVLRLGVGTAQHGIIIGRSQSGKSNLLHVIICQLALRYSPEELELYLLDHKDGVEFNDYLTVPLLHARVVPLHGDRGYALSVLQELDQIRQRRSVMLSGYGGRLNEYRKKTGKKLPRILIVIDEYETLLGKHARDDITLEVESLLDTLTRQGASYGMHILLASQAPSEWSSQGFQSIGVRLVLQSNWEHARALLDSRDLEGINPTKLLIGQAAHFDPNASTDRMTRLEIPEFSLSTRMEVLNQISTRFAAANYPVPATFDGKKRLPLLPFVAAGSGLSPGSPGSPLKILVGESARIGVPGSFVLARQDGANVLIAGGRIEEALGIISAFFVSTAVQRTVMAATFVFVNISNSHSVDDLVDFFRKVSRPSHVDSCQPQNLARRLEELESEIARREKVPLSHDSEIILVLVGLDSFDIRSRDSVQDARDRLRDIARRGPRHGIHVLVQAVKERPLEDWFYAFPDEFSIRIGLRMAADESADIFEGDREAATLADARAFLKQGREPTYLIKPFSLAYSADDQSMLAAQLLDAAGLKGEVGASSTAKPIARPREDA